VTSGPFYFSFQSGMARRGPVFFHPRGKKFEVDQIDGSPDDGTFLMYRIGSRSKPEGVTVAEALKR
jgi:hypothetical protein